MESISLIDGQPYRGALIRFKDLSPSARRRILSRTKGEMGYVQSCEKALMQGKPLLLRAACEFLNCDFGMAANPFRVGTIWEQ